jgi:hypothetical protein
MRSAWLPALALLAACGTADGGSGVLSARGFEEQTLGAQCDRGVACGIFPDRDTCRAWMGEGAHYPGTNAIDVAVEAGRITIDPGLAHACIEGLAKVSCQTIFSGNPIWFLDPYCRLAWIPKQAYGDPCFYSTDFTSPQAECVPGTYCGAGFSCTPNACCTGGICADVGFMMPGLGEPCDPGNGCQPALGCKDNRCVIPEVEGDPCSESCSNGLICRLDGSDPGRTHCLPEPPSVPEGQSCLEASCASPAVPCLLTPDGQDVVCVRPRERGEACDDLAPCNQFYLYCHDGVCTDLPQLGENCDEAPQCLGSTAGVHCSVGLCEALRPDGSPCFQPNDCQSGICTNGECAAPAVCP